MDNRLLSIAVVAAVVAAVVLLSRVVRRASSRMRLRSSVAARRLDSLANSIVFIVAAATLLCGAAALLPQSLLPSGLDRAWLVGSTIGLATGIPFAAERRRLRRHLRDLPVPDDPVVIAPLRGIPHAAAVAALARGDLADAIDELRPAIEAEPPQPEALRLRALVAAAQRDSRSARAYALRAAQLDHSRWDALLDTGLALCRRQCWNEGLRLLHRAVEISGGDARAQLGLAQGEAMAGRLREAVNALERSRRLTARAR